MTTPEIIRGTFCGVPFEIVYQRLARRTETVFDLNPAGDNLVAGWPKAHKIIYGLTEAQWMEIKRAAAQGKRHALLEANP